MNRNPPPRREVPPRPGDPRMSRAPREARQGGDRPNVPRQSYPPGGRMPPQQHEQRRPQRPINQAAQPRPGGYSDQRGGYPPPRQGPYQGRPQQPIRGGGQIPPGYQQHAQASGYPQGMPYGHPQAHLPAQSPPAKKQKTLGGMIFAGVFNLIFYGLTLSVILMALMFAFSEKSSASIFGYRFYTVLTDSMVPHKDSPPGGFYSGDIVVTKMIDGKNAKVNDIVTFSVGESSYLTHRVVEKLSVLNDEPGDYLVTKGDANATKDPPIEAEKVHGKVVYVIPHAGSMIQFAQDNFWLCLVCVLSTFGFILVLKAYFFGEDKAALKAT